MSSVARRFHDETTHTPYSVRTSGHTLDWDNKPFPFKIYTDAPAVELPRDDLDPVRYQVHWRTFGLVGWTCHGSGRVALAPAQKDS